MAKVYWKAPSQDNWNVASNWSTGSVPGISDDVYFTDSSSSWTCSLDIDATVRTIIWMSNYSGDFQGGTNALTIKGPLFSDDGNGDRDYGEKGLFFPNDGTAHFGNTLGYIQPSRTPLFIDSTKGWGIDDDLGITFKSITLSANARGILAGSASQISFIDNTTNVILGASSILTINQNTYFGYTADCTIFSIGSGAVFQGVSKKTVSHDIVGGGTLYIPTISDTIRAYPTPSEWQFTETETDGTFKQVGPVTLGTYASGFLHFNTFSMVVPNSNHKLFYSTNHYALTAGIINMGANASGATLYINLMDSTIACMYWNRSNPYDTGRTNIALGSASITSYSDWTFGVTHYVDVGTSSVVFTGDGNSANITFNGSSFNNFAVTKNHSSADVYLIDAAYFYGNFIKTDPYAGLVTAYDNVIVDGNSINLRNFRGTSGKTFTSNGSACNLDLGGTSTITSDLIFNGSAAINGGGALVAQSLTLGPSAYLRVNNNGGTMNWDFNSSSSSDPVLTLGNDATLYIDVNHSGFKTRFYKSVSGPIVSAGPGSAISSSYNDLYFYANADNIICTIDGLNYTGTHTCWFTGNSRTDYTFQLISPFKCSEARFYESLPGKKGFFDTNNQDMTCVAALFVGANTATARFDAKYGYSTISTGSYYGSTYNTGACNEQLQDSTWVCTGSVYSFGSTHNYTRGPGNLYKFTAQSGNTTVTLNGCSLPNVDGLLGPSSALGFTGGLTIDSGRSCHIMSGNYVYLDSTLNLGVDSSFIHDIRLTLNTSNRLYTDVLVLSHPSRYFFGGEGDVLIQLPDGVAPNLDVLFPSFTYSGKGPWFFQSSSWYRSISFPGEVHFTRSGIDISQYDAGALRIDGTLTLSGSDASFLITGGYCYVHGENGTIVYDATAGRPLLSIGTGTPPTFKTLVVGQGTYLNKGGTNYLALQGPSTPLIMQDDATLNTLPSSGAPVCFLTASSSYISTGERCAITGTIFSGYSYDGCHCVPTLPDITGTIPSFSTNTTWTIGNNYVWTTQNKNNTATRCHTYLTGDIKSINGKGAFYIFNDKSATSFTFSGNGYGIDASVIYVGSGHAFSTITANYGSGYYKCGDFQGITYNVGTCTENYMTSTWDCSKSWTYGSTHKINHQAETLTCTGNTTVINNGKKLNYLVINAPGKTVVLGDNLAVHGYRNIAGTLNKNSKKFDALGDLIVTTQKSY